RDGEHVELGNGMVRKAQNLEERNAGNTDLGDQVGTKGGDEVRRTGRVMQVPVGDEMIGRVVNPLGQPIDGKGPIETSKTRPIEQKHQALWIVSQLMSHYKLELKQLTH